MSIKVRKPTRTNIGVLMNFIFHSMEMNDSRYRAILRREYRVATDRGQVHAMDFLAEEYKLVGGGDISEGFDMIFPEITNQERVRVLTQLLPEASSTVQRYFRARIRELQQPSVGLSRPFNVNTYLREVQY